MPFTIVHNNLLHMRTDAIVNTTDEIYSGGGGVDYEIHQAAGPELFNACSVLGKLRLGEAKATSGYNLPVKYIIHTSGPYWQYGSRKELAYLTDCYKNSIKLAREKGCRSVAFPLISSQTKRFPKEIALSLAINAIRESLQESDDIDVYLVIYGKRERALSERLFPEIQKIIEQDYKPSKKYIEDELIPPDVLYQREIQFSQMSDGDVSGSRKVTEQNFDTLIEDLLNNPTKKNLDKVPIDESFAQMLARILSERDLKHSVVYDELGMTNVGFWKLLKGKSNPSKMTVFGLSIVFQLSIEDATEMLMKAGYAFNPSSLQDVIISGLIQKKVYDRYVIDDLLYALDLRLLPGAIIA